MRAASDALLLPASPHASTWLADYSPLCSDTLPMGMQPGLIVQTQYVQAPIAVVQYGQAPMCHAQPVQGYSPHDKGNC